MAKQKLAVSKEFVSCAHKDRYRARVSRRGEMFLDWLASQEIPADYDRYTLGACALDNASDAPVNRIIEVAKDTVAFYLDQRDAAIDAGIVEAR